MIMIMMQFESGMFLLRHIKDFWFHSCVCGLNDCVLYMGIWLCDLSYYGWWRGTGRYNHTETADQRPQKTRENDPNISLMLVQRLRRWTNIKLIFNQHISSDVSSLVVSVLISIIT